MDGPAKVAHIVKRADTLTVSAAVCTAVSIIIVVELPLVVDARDKDRLMIHGLDASRATHDERTKAVDTITPGTQTTVGSTAEHLYREVRATVGSEDVCTSVQS
eukprot:TRINITY_DN2213_c0_g2_i1.p2 TRINITY_DN2213_c0_g2~~TRINITY_DN2213_c0_g2_i1.p2  ORF type:complete len:104 (-),score=18.02 TRINITY_DN2213_c0_g2_i1:254-565(-)